MLNKRRLNNLETENYIGLNLNTNSMRKLIIVSLIVLLIASIAPSLAAEKIMISGSSLGLNLTRDAAAAFNAEQSDCMVNVSGGDSTTGLYDISKNKTSDIAMTSREVTVDEKISLGDKFTQYEIMNQGIVIAVSRPIYDAGVKELTTQQVRDIYAGKITNWNEVGGPDKKIFTIAEMPTLYPSVIFGQSVMNGTTTTRVTLTAENDTVLLRSLVSRNDAIAYLAFTDVVNAIGIDGILPTSKNITKGSYKLVQPFLYFYTYGTPATCATKFIEFLKSQKGMQIIAKYGIPI